MYFSFQNSIITYHNTITRVRGKIRVFLDRAVSTVSKTAPRMAPDANDLVTVVTYIRMTYDTYVASMHIVFFADMK